MAPKTIKKAQAKKTPEKKAREPFDPDKLEVIKTFGIGKTEGGAKFRAVVYNYDGGANRLKFTGVSESGKEYPLKSLTEAQATELASKMSAILKAIA